ncbi:MAG: hypothetical protein LQ349_004391 [Xanthoria aureola]|nr:MAG: hypothetical protein LQ349_004391 [Xanthoria aureola]
MYWVGIPSLNLFIKAVQLLLHFHRPFEIMASFQGKVIAVTGAASGIGQATARLLAARGATVSIVDVQQEALTTTADSIQQATPDAKVLTKLVDVSSSQQVDAWIQDTVSRFGKIDGAANVAGIVGRDLNNTLAADAHEEDFDRVMAVNVKGTFNCLKAQLGAMKDQGSGSIVNATSVAGVRGYPRSIAYTTSKHAIVGMTKTAAVDYSDRNIRVNAIAPGAIDTPIMRNNQGGATAAEFRAQAVQAAPMHRFGTVEEAAQLILFLLGGESTYCTGSVFMIDGGMMARI